MLGKRNKVYYEEPSLDKALNMKTVASSSEDAECDQLQQQVMHQFLPQDYDPRSCRSILSEEEKKEMMLFNTRRIIEAFGRAQVHPLQPKTIDQNVICQQCTSIVEPGSLVVSTEKTGSDVHWHPGCFTCTICHQLLFDLTYFSDDGKRVFCGRHFAERFKLRCAACDEIILCESYTEAEGRNWHRNHFLCTGCSGPLAGQHYIMRDGHPVCRRCFDQQNATDCDDDTRRDDQPRQKEEEEEKEEEKSKTTMHHSLPGTSCCSWRSSLAESSNKGHVTSDGGFGSLSVATYDAMGHNHHHHHHDHDNLHHHQQVERIEGRPCTSVKNRPAANPHQPTGDLLTSDYSPHEHTITDWLHGRRCSPSRNPDDDLTRLSAPNLTTSFGDAAKKTLKSNLKSRRKGGMEGRLLNYLSSSSSNHHHHHHQQVEMDEKEDRRSVRFHLAPSASAQPRRSPSKTPLSQSEVPPEAPLRFPAQHEWQPITVEGQGTSGKQMSKALTNSSIHPCKHYCVGRGHALHEPLPQVQGRQCQGETYQGHEMCPPHGMTRFRGCQQHQHLSNSVLSHPTQGHSSQTERSFQCHSLLGHAPRSHGTSTSNYNWHQGLPCQGRLFEGRRWCHRRLGRWTRSHDNGIEQKHLSYSSSLPGHSFISLNLQPTGNTRSDEDHASVACGRCAPSVPPLSISGCSSKQRRLAEASVVCAGHAGSEVRQRSDGNRRGQSSRPLLYGDIPHMEECKWTKDVSSWVPSVSYPSVCSPSTASSASNDSIDDPEHEEECLQRSQEATTGGSPPAKNENNKNENKKTKKENKKTKKENKKSEKENKKTKNENKKTKNENKKMKNSEETKGEEIEASKTLRSTSKSLPELNKTRDRESNREKRKRCIVS